MMQKWTYHLLILSFVIVQFHNYFNSLLQNITSKSALKAQESESQKLLCLAEEQEGGGEICIWGMQADSC